MKVSTESSIKLTAKLLQSFKSLIDAEEDESAYQRFLQENPVILEPLAAEIIPQARLGLEYITDFVLRLHDNRYIVVEIERPQDRIFTSQGDLTARFNHAVGQVLDFQHWVAENSAYAQKNMPGIVSPHGLLVMGLRKNLTEREASKLRRWQQNSRDIEHLTYDDLLVRSSTLLKSLRNH
ncbi:Shedu anti-phage system protein SduA domain-containing protein [Microbispora rosea]|uniref:Shedu anti-phage system protein SduA domain-containing protein n=1 Tax=Microbispora rosea TaxID=58117 RepID=UPI003D911BB9